MTHPSPHAHSHGFTLIELAIALMVIGLLIGGVLKGQELIENAKVTSFIRQINAYDTATMIFRNTYGALPGDIRQPTRIPNCTAVLCNMAGNGDGQISNAPPTRHETFNFFPHLLKAGMIQGSTEGFTLSTTLNDARSPLVFPATPFDMNIASYYFALSGTMTNTYVTPGHDDAEQLSVKTAHIIQIDTKMDDGRPTSGDIQVNEYSDLCPVASSGIDYDNTIVARGCLLVIKAKS